MFKLNKMFNHIFIILVLIVLSFSIIGCKDKKENDDISNYINEELNYYKKTKHYIIYGNYEKLDQKTVQDKIDNLKNEVIIIYYTNKDLILKNQYIYNNKLFTMIYYYEDLLIKDSYTPKDINNEDLKSKYLTFYNERINNKHLNDQTDKINLLKELYNGTDRFEEEPYGIIDINYSVKKIDFNEETNLYLLEFNLMSYCGKKAYENGLHSYNKKVLNDSVKINLTADQIKFQDNYQSDIIRTGGTPILKDYWPIDNPVDKCINSNYCDNKVMGYSLVNGFTSDNKISNNPNIIYEYNKLFNNKNYILTANNNFENENEVSWDYQMTSDYENNLNSNISYLFEMNNISKAIKIEYFNLIYDINVRYKQIFLGEYGQTETQYFDVLLSDTINFIN